MLMTKEHYDLMGQFEREHRGRRMDRESKESWPRGIIYQDGHVNELFAAYRRGYAFAVADYRSDLQNLEASRDGYRRDAERLQTEIDTLKSSKAEQSEECTPPASAQDDAKDERQAFEVWGKKKKMPLARIGEQYDDFWVDHAWNGWQARASVAAPAAGDALPNLPRGWQLALNLAIDAIENAAPAGQDWPVNWPAILHGLTALRAALAAQVPHKGEAA